MKKNSVRFLALFLAVCLTAGLMALPALADEPAAITDGVSVTADSSGVNVTVGGADVAENDPVTVTNPATVTIAADIITDDDIGLEVLADGSGITVNAEGIDAEEGVSVVASEGATATVTIGEAAESGEGTGTEETVITADTDAVTVNNANAEVNITVNGNVDAGENGIAADMEEAGITTVTFNGDLEAGETAIDVLNAGGTTNVTVTGDVDAGTTGVEVSGGGKTDILIEGTLTAGQQAVVVDETVTEDNLSLTVWKIETPAGTAPSSVVTTEEEEISIGEIGEVGESPLPGEYSTAPVNPATPFTDTSVQYIIKVETPDASQGTLSAAGENGSKSHGYDVAKEGETVTLQITVKDGYELTGAFNGEGDSPTEITPDNDGNYFITVPKGGGIYLSVTLKEKETTPDEPENPDNPDNPPSNPDTPDTPNGGNGNGNGGNPSATPSNVITVNVVDELVVTGTVDENTVTKKVSDVLKPLPKNSNLLRETVASESPIVFSGVVDFGGAFRNAAEPVITVPIKNSNFKAGSSYTITFGDDYYEDYYKGSWVVVKCSKDGVLEIPFPKDAAGLGFVVQKGQADWKPKVIINNSLDPSASRRAAGAPNSTQSAAAANAAGAPDTSVAKAGANNGNPTAPGTGASEGEDQIIDWARKNGIIP